MIVARRHRRRSRWGARLGQRLTRSWLVSYLCAHRFLVLEGAIAAAALAAALLLSWPSPEPARLDDGQREAWRRSLTVTSHAVARARFDVIPEAGEVDVTSTPVSLSVSSKERIAGPRLMARLEPAMPEVIVPEEGLAPLPIEPIEEEGPEPERPAEDAVGATPEKPEKAPAVAPPPPRREWAPGTQPPWLRYAAVAANPLDSRPVVAVVLDDLGLRRRLTTEIIGLPGPLTLAFLPYAGGVEKQAEAARRAGHELLVHVPMEPLGSEDPGPQALLTSLSDDEFLRRLRRDLARFDGYVGVNNHMGSKATADSRKMALIMRELGDRGLLFLDSRTTPLSVAGAQALRHGVPHAGRDVFLDNIADVGHITEQLRHVEAIARRTGAAVAIGHPYPETVAALSEWLPTLERRGFNLVPVTAVVAQRVCRDGTLPAACRAYAALHTPVN